MTTKQVKVLAPYARTRNNMSTRSWSTQYKQVKYGATIADITSVKNLSVGSVMDDIVTPGFAQRVTDGAIIQNPMRMSQTSYSGSDTGWAMSNSAGTDVYTFGGSCVPYRYGIPGFTSHTFDIPGIISYSQTKTLGSVKTSNLMGLVALAEFRKTVRMLANPLGTLASIVKHTSDLRKANKAIHIEVLRGGSHRRINGKVFRVRKDSKPRGPGRVVTKPKDSIIIPIGEAISGSVLAYNLGLGPLLMDVDAIFKDIPKAHQLARRTFRDTYTDTQESVITTPLGEDVFSHSRTTNVKHKLTVRTAIMAADVFNVPQDFGASIYDVPEAAWELIPYSFLVDYVLNVGDLLAAQRALWTQSIIASCTVVRIESAATTSFNGLTTSSSSNWKVTQHLSGNYTNEVITKTRSVGLDHLGGLAFKPGSKVLTPSHITNVLSLTVQQLIGMRTGKPRTFY